MLDPQKCALIQFISNHEVACAYQLWFKEKDLRKAEQLIETGTPVAVSWPPDGIKITSDARSMDKALKGKKLDTKAVKLLYIGTWVEVREAEKKLKKGKSLSNSKETRKNNVKKRLYSDSEDESDREKNYKKKTNQSKSVHEKLLEEIQNDSGSNTDSEDENADKKSNGGKFDDDRCNVGSSEESGKDDDTGVVRKRKRNNNVLVIRTLTSLLCANRNHKLISANPFQRPCGRTTELGHSGVFVSSSKLARLDKSSTSKFTTELMDIVFTREELATSSVTGQPSNFDPGAKAKPALDLAKKEAVEEYVFTNSKTQNKDTMSLIKKAMRDKLTNAAASERNRKKNKKSRSDRNRNKE
ncbi:hypothetical protein QAD02_020289 [Eretmocerus hayati]|uniref:Uncharacterized protein n=1 Tax=Eretmocerus hayati TaxID=131215 RepID=A0ACC2PM30_9HYME|nr:hypothetical protein QAD02_020289 [Eretmocerus hayati]